MSLVEVAVEASLQSLFQMSCFLVFDYGTRVSSWMQVFSLFSSGISVNLGLSRGLYFLSSSLTSIGHHEKTMKVKVMNSAWNILFGQVFWGQFVFHYLGFSLFLKYHFQNFTESNQISFLSTCTINFIYPIFSCIIVNKNCFGKLRQAQLKCVLVSIYFFLCIGCWINCCVMVISSTQLHGIGFIFINFVLAFNCLYLSIFFLYSSFIISSFMDVFDLEMLESKNSCSLPSMQLGIVLFVHLIGLVMGFFALDRLYHNN